MLSVPLQSLDVRGDVWDTFAHVQVTSVFRNQFQFPIETEFNFCLDSSAVIDSLKVTVGDRELVGEVQEKSKAWVTFTDAIEDDKRTALLEKIEDEYSLHVGNLQSNESLIVSYTYLSKLSMTDGAYTFVYPTNIGQRFGATGAPSGRQIDNILRVDSGQVAPMVYFSMTFHSNGGVAEVFSRSSPNDIHVQRKSSNEVEVTALALPATGDLNLFMRTANGSGLYSAELGADQYLLLSHRLPREPLSDAASKEYIFILDRSGSMEGAKMAEAKKALADAVELLPAGASFNIVSFGSDYSAMFERSVAATEGNKRKALSILSSYGADMGGTEILQCLRASLEGAMTHIQFAAQDEVSSVASKGETVIVALTDGQILELSEVFDLVRRHKETRPLRIFSIGIGHDASREFIEGVARLTDGVSQMVMDSPDIAWVARQMVESTLFRLYRNVSLEVDGEEVEHVGRDVIYPGQHLSAIVKLPKRSVAVSHLSLVALDDGERKVWEVAVPETDASAIDALLLEKLYAHEMILHNDNPGKRQRLSDEQIVALSVQHNIMNQLTSFVVVDSEKATPAGQEKPEYQRLRHLSGSATGLQSDIYADVLLIDVNPRSLGIAASDGSMIDILPRNLIIPTKRSRIFTTSQDPD